MMRSDNLLVLKVITPEGLIIQKTHLNAINIPLAGVSSIGVRPGHAPLIAETAQGTVRYRDADSEEKINLYSGVLEIKNNVVTILSAGEIEISSSKAVESPENKYKRLMQTLVKQIEIDNDVKSE